MPIICSEFVHYGETDSHSLLYNNFERTVLISFLFSPQVFLLNNKFTALAPFSVEVFKPMHM